MISVKYTLTAEDYTNYYVYVMWDAPERKKKRLKFYLRQGLINAAVLAFLIYLNIFRYFSFLLYIYGGIVLLNTLAPIFAARNNLKKQAQKIAADEQNQSIFKETQAEFSETGIYLKDEFIDSHLQWRAIVKKQENEAYYFLFVSSVQAFIFPKRIFKTAVEKAQFEKLLSQHLSFDAEVGHLVKN